MTMKRIATSFGAKHVLFRIGFESLQKQYHYYY